MHTMKERNIWSKRTIWKWQHFPSLLNSSKIARPFLVSDFYLSSITDPDDKGRSHYLIRKSQKRKHQEIEDDEKESMRKDLDNYKEWRIHLESQIVDLNKQIDELYHFKEMNEINAQKLKKLYDRGVINEEGKLI